MTMFAVADAPFRSFYAMNPFLAINEWWHALLLIGVTGLLLGLMITIYVWDSRELPKSVVISLVMLRLAAFIAIVFFFLNPEKQIQREIAKSPRIPILIDTSSSMATPDVLDANMNSVRRIDAASNILIAPSTQDQPSLIDQLRAGHDVAVYRFSDEEQPTQIATYRSLSDELSPDEVAQIYRDRQLQQLWQARRLILFGAILVGCSTLLISYYARMRYIGNMHPIAMATLPVGTFTFVAGLLLVGASQLHSSDSTTMMIAGLQTFAPIPPAEVQLAMDDANATADRDNDQTPDNEPGELDRESLIAQMNPEGARTRIGDAIAGVLRQERANSLAGIFLVSDGQQTEGNDVQASLHDAVESGIRMFPIGLGSPIPPRTLRINELTAPQRIYPNDKFQIKAVIQAAGLEGEQAVIELQSLVDTTDNDGDADTSPSANPDDDRSSDTEPNAVTEHIETVTLGADDELIALEFEQQEGQIGNRNFRILITPVNDDLTEIATSRSIRVEVVERRNRVLLIAGGPNRDYRFLRDQLYRDSDVELDIYLQTAQSGASQEAASQIFEFPTLRDQIDEYDCIIAFDPDWRDLSLEQVTLLERWIAEEAGGLVVVAGPVHTPQWTKRPRGDSTMDLIRRLYPVTFYSQGSVSYGVGRFAGETAFPIAFTREGRSAPFLWLEDSAEASFQAWDESSGVFGYYGVNDAKPGAVILANFSDPKTAVNDELPIYLATQFYGAGRVYFQASAEMWRLRADDTEYFEQYYTKLIHWVSQGRLMRDSKHGLLIADKTQCLQGDSISFQAILRDRQAQPLTLESVEVAITLPNDRVETLRLDQASGGMSSGSYVGRYYPPIEGNYRVTLPVPGEGAEEILTLDFDVQLPRFEQQRLQRHDQLLESIAEKTGGEYLIGMPSEWDANNYEKGNVISLIGDQQLQGRIFLPATLDERFSRKLMIWFLIVISVLLCGEWTMRRLHRLA